MEKIELLGMGVHELEIFLTGIGEPSYRGRQIYKWIYAKEVGSFHEMSDLPGELRKRLDAAASISLPKIIKTRVSTDGTRKFLMELKDRKTIESVVIPQEK